MAWILESLEMSIRFSLHIVHVLLWEPMATQTLTKVISLPCTKMLRRIYAMHACTYTCTFIVVLLVALIRKILAIAKVRLVLGQD